MVFIFGFMLVSRTAYPAAAEDNYEYRIAHATFFGGSEYEEAREVIVLPDGGVILGGQTQSPDMTVTADAVQGVYRGEKAGTGHTGKYGGDLFVTRMNADASRIIASTYLGGSKQERNVYGMELDRNGNIVVMTATRSTDFATTRGAYQERYGGGPADFVAAKLSPDLQRLIWCTYIGASGNDWGRGGLALDSEDNVYLVGNTNSPDFPASTDAYQADAQGGSDGLLVKLNADASRLLFATRLGGSRNEDIMGIRIDTAGNIHLAGHTWSDDFPVIRGAPQKRFGGGESDGFLAGFSPDGSQLLYSTFLGGSRAEFGEHRLALLESGALIFTGYTGSKNFPVTSAAYQRRVRGSGGGFITKLSADHTQWDFSTVLGGSGGELYLLPTPDPKGNIMIIGSTSSRDFPVTSSAIQRIYGGGKKDAVFAVLSADGSRLLYATYLGGSGDDLVRGLALGANGEVYLVGKTDSVNFPVTPDAAQTKPGGKYDAFFVRLDPAPVQDARGPGVPGEPSGEAGGNAVRER